MELIATALHFALTVKSRYPTVFALLHSLLLYKTASFKWQKPSDNNFVRYKRKFPS
jgi:hypothetical protein